MTAAKTPSQRGRSNRNTDHVSFGDLRIAERDWAKVDADAASGCWVWAGSQVNGYGTLREGRKHWKAHRYFFSRLYGDIPPGLDLDHLCRVRACVRPDHLEPVTRSVNLRRGVRADQQRAAAQARTHCKRGHERSPQTTIVTREGWFKCRICRDAAVREWRTVNRPPKGPRTACQKGHEFTPENTMLDRRGSRRCRACSDAYQRNYSAARRVR